jgi:hypothetical protein
MEALVVMVDEDPQAKLVQMNISAKRERFADKVGTALPQGVVEALDVGRFSTLLADCSMAFRWDHRRVGHPKVGVANGSLAIISWQRLPELAASGFRPIANGKAHDASRLPFECNPDPYLVALMPYE